MPRPVSSSPLSSPGALRSAVPAVWSLVLTAVLLGPFLVSPGCLLFRDAVSTPRSFLTDGALGLSDAAARAVPQDALLAWVSTVVDGCLAVTVLLGASLWGAGWGAARLVAVLLPTAGPGARLVAATLTIWNPYVAERLLQGHWSLLAGYAALPWAICAATAIRRGRPGGWPALAVSLAAGGLTPTGALLATVAVLVVLAMPGGRTRPLPRLGAAVALGVVVSLPWLVATALAGGGTEADPAGVRAFAARAEPLLATVGSVAGLGGIWNGDAVPASRGTPWAAVGTLLLLGVVACGVPALWRRHRNPVIAATAVLAATVTVTVALAATGPGLAAGEWAMVHVPGAGLLRDTQKWVAWAVPAYALAAAAGVQTLTRRVGGSERVWAATASVALLVALPDLAWGVGGTLGPVRYPDGWREVAGIVTAGDGDVAVLPAGMFRMFPWSGPVPVLDPAPRMLRADVLQTGTLVVAGGAVAGEGRRAEEVEELLLAGADASELAARGIGWVLVEHGTPGALGDAQVTLDALENAYSDQDLSLYRVDGAAAEGSPPHGIAIGAHLVWLLVAAGGVLGQLLVHRRGFARAREQA
ncbi:hypothetical protein OED52_18130 [Rhodococcus sp. Z13]|uniref:Uncharacterized protein n=1 Tax=Rhodococcus sacchari TaxID=2962047 RepID=A0ACD4DEP7_9NOCA|nr:hypothetical protein [Rhodococcus sp. Z13]UYP18545.1 hypothetical protein OED52_18130 [Rhodococcus sp. Z13]